MTSQAQPRPQGRTVERRLRL